MSYVKPSLKDAQSEHRKSGFKRFSGKRINGPRNIIPYGSDFYPDALANIPHPPDCLYLIGDPEALQEGLAVIGARKATPYGLECAKLFAGIAAEQGIPIISGGAYGCDSQAHRAAIEYGAPTVVFLGGGCDMPYPAGHIELFQQVVDCGGAIVSEHEWDYPPLPFAFRARNRLIAGLAKATLIVEAGLPSGTFSTADDALAAGKDVMVVPGAITSPTSAGSNKLLYQGAHPIVDVESFTDALFDLFGVLKMEEPADDFASLDALGIPKRMQQGMSGRKIAQMSDPLYLALLAKPMRMDDILRQVEPPPGIVDANSWVAIRLAELERDRLVSRYPDGRYGPCRIPR